MSEIIPRPNIIYLHSHDTGRYVQPYGHGVPTPNYQRLAAGGTLFRQAFCVTPSCSASRSALVTGQYPHCNGMLGLAHRGFKLNDYGQHIIHTLHPHGYRSTLIGVQHVAADPSVIGYDEIVDLPSRNSADVAPAAAAFLRSRPAEPFFLAAGFSETHRVFPELDDPAEANYVLPPAPLPDTPETRQDMARFIASARRLDAGVGMILDALDEAGLAENTLVICTTDHGLAFPRMKANLTDHGTGVTLIMRGPGGFNGGKVVDGMVSHMDIFPTICDLLEIDAPSWLQGRSLLPLVCGDVDQIHDALFLEQTFHAAYQPIRAVRTTRWKYIRHYGDYTRTVLPNCDNGESKDLWMAHGWGEQEIAREQLFDLIFDPNEAHNLANDPQHQPVVEEMRQRLLRWMEATDDPLLQGEPVPAPPGAIVTDPAALSPS